MRFVVSDVDGTLLKNGEEKLDKNAEKFISHILSSKAIFAVASGRSYSELKEIFCKYEDEIYFIPCDGALCIYGGKTLFDFPLKKGYSGENVAYHGKYLTYIKSKKSALTRALYKKYRGHTMQITSEEEIENPIYKITDYDMKKDSDLNFVYQSKDITEYVESGIDKGKAIKKLIEILDIPFEETCSFGDGENDLEMFKATKLSYAVSEAPPKIKKATSKVCFDMVDEIRKLI